MRHLLNHWTCGRSIPDTVSELNLILRGGSGYFHFQHSRRVLGKRRWWVQTRMQRWLWRKHGGRRALGSDYPVATLQERYGLWPLPLTAGWTGQTPRLNAHEEASRKAEYGKPVRPV